MNKTIFNDYRTAVVLDYIDGKDINIKTEFFQPQYFINELDISDLKSYIKMLAKKRNLVNIEKNIVKISDLGRKYLKKKKIYVDFFKFASPVITVNEFYDEFKNNRYLKDFDDIILHILKKKINSSDVKTEFEDIKNMSLDCALIHEKKKEWDKAATYFLIVLYFDICGMNIYDDILAFIEKRLDESKVINLHNHIYISSKCIEGIKKCNVKKKEEEFEILFKQFPTDINLCNKGNLIELYDDLLNGNFDINKWNSILKNNYSIILKKARGLRKLNKVKFK